METGIYLDHNATTPMWPEVLDVVARVSRDVPGNASSVHSYGQRALGIIESSREAVADFLGAMPSDIVFVSGGTEANNLALYGLLLSPRRLRSHLIISAIEHPSVLRAADWLEREWGAEITRVRPGPDGVIRPDEIDAAIRSDTALVSVMLSNNELGTIQPVREIALRSRSRGVPVHSDCVQAAGKMPIDMEDMGVEMASISAHKMHGPKGAGALCVRGSPLEPLIRGGSQERDRRAGTENVAAIAGFAEACRITAKRMEHDAQTCRSLRDRFEAGILDAGATVFAAGAPRVANTSFFAFPAVDGEKLLIALDLEGIALSTGSACSSGLIEPSHVLLACGHPPDLCRRAVRFSCGPENSIDQIEEAVRALRATVRRIGGGLRN